MRALLASGFPKKQMKSDICTIYLQLSLEYFIISD